MQDRVSLYPGRVTLTPVAGQANTYDMVRADQPTQEGTPLSKASLLKDTTAALFGLGSDAVPDEVFADLGKYNEYWWKRIAADTTEYVHSTNRNAYPDSGTQDGYTYTYLGVPFENAVTTPKIEIGSYMGTGTYGASNPNSLTFSFEPKLVAIVAYTWKNSGSSTIYGGNSSASNDWAWLIYPEIISKTASGSQTGLGYASIGVKSDNKKTVSWYSTSAYYQYNGDLHTYYYIGIG